MDVQTTILGLIFIIIYLTMIQSKKTYEPLEATCKNPNVMNCSKICNKGSATLKCKTKLGSSKKIVKLLMILVVKVIQKDQLVLMINVLKVLVKMNGFKII